MEDGEGAGGGVAEPGQDHGAGGGAAGVARHAVRLLPVRVGRRPGHQQQTGQDGQLFEIKHCGSDQNCSSRVSDQSQVITIHEVMKRNCCVDCISNVARSGILSINSNNAPMEFILSSPARGRKNNSFVWKIFH